MDIPDSLPVYCHLYFPTVMFILMWDFSFFLVWVALHRANSGKLYSILRLSMLFFFFLLLPCHRPFFRCQVFGASWRDVSLSFVMRGKVCWDQNLSWWKSCCETQHQHLRRKLNSYTKFSHLILRRCLGRSPCVAWSSSPVSPRYVTSSGKCLGNIALCQSTGDSF